MSLCRVCAVSSELNKKSHVRRYAHVQHSLTSAATRLALWLKLATSTARSPARTGRPACVTLPAKRRAVPAGGRSTSADEARCSTTGRSSTRRRKYVDGTQRNSPPNGTEFAEKLRIERKCGDEKSAVSATAGSPLGTVTIFQGAVPGIVNVPAQVARAQEGSLLRRLECLSCPCSGYKKTLHLSLIHI